MSNQKKLERKHKAKPAPELRNQINNLKNRIKRQVKQLKIAKWNSIIGSVTQNNPSEHQFWPKIRNSPLLDQNPLPSLPQSIKQKSELFANHFENAFTNPKITKPINKPFNYYKSKRYNQPITPKELNTAIRKTTNSTSTDNITNKFIKNLGDPAKSLLLYLFNASLTLHYVPS